MKIDKSKFRDKNRNTFITQGLFIEHQYNPDMAVFTLGDDDKEYKGKTYPSLKKIYLETEDPTEYLFAMEVFGNFAHWKRLCSKYLKTIVEEWRQELELRLRAKGIRANIRKAEEGNYNAAKWVADKGWETKRGRSTKAEIEGRIEQDKKLFSDVSDDLERLGINVQ